MEFDLPEGELFELSELYPGDDGDSEDDLEKDLEEVDGFSQDDIEDYGEREDDVEVEGEQPQVASPNDRLLNSLKEEYGDTIFYNTKEENDVILHCEDLELQKLLIKNRVRAKQLRMLHGKLSGILRACVDNVRLHEDSHKIQHLGIPKTDVWKLGTPYFKDRDFFASPENRDAVKKRQNKEFSFINFKRGRHWHDEHQILLQSTIERLHWTDCYEDLRHKVRICKVKSKFDDENVAIKEELRGYENELNEMESMPVKYKTPPILYENINWYKVADAFKGARTPNECKALWNIYLHPQINKKLWTAEESVQIKGLVKQYNCQNWDAIARELGTNRSGYLVFLNYFTNLWSKFKTDRFTEEEDARILNLVDKYRVGSFIPWRIISTDFRDRSKGQIYHRYKYYLSSIHRRGPFSEAEDALLLHLVSKYGEDFRKCAQFLPHRTCVQIRNRYRNSLCGNVQVNRGNFTVHEDKAILDHVKRHGRNDWLLVANRIGRNTSHVRHRHSYLQRFLSHPGRTLENMQRRSHELLYRHNFHRDHRIRTIVDRLKNYEVVSLRLIEDLLARIALPTSIQDNPWDNKPKSTFYDRQIIKFLKGTCKVQREYKSYRDSDVADSRQRIIKLLPSLFASPRMLEGVNLDEVFDRERDMLATITRAEIDSVQIPSSSKYVIPPTLNTILGLRGLLVKYQIYKESADELPKAPVETEFADEHALFSSRLYALLKWPSILSQFFAEQLQADEPKHVPDHLKPKRTVGRPRKMFEKSKKSADVTLVLPRDGKRSASKKPKEKTQTLAYKRMKLDECVDGDAKYLRMKLRSKEAECQNGTSDCEVVEVHNSLSVDVSNLAGNKQALLVDSSVIQKLGSCNKNIVILAKDDVVIKKV
ncbi:hypothetical protein PPYR_14008 [Photinus pyralis]|uniref:snRNA-activating protein complex subunit 4 n=1 Tax=Photinus pyralis TaxID=7054 RepID=A0A5N4A412_PHOPY|nr:snRNA-activating protein complex subunit 4 [Photinus pyralis]KAB0792047.1 hypothetical protein PPYR_14008 [Photinus pyralis]